VGDTAVHAVAIFATIYRLSYRKRTRGLWWDDYFAAFALAVDIVSLVFTWVESLMDPVHNVSARTAVSWILTFIYNFIIWPARISLILSISRILTPAEPLFKYTILVAVLFFLLMTTSIIQVAVNCGRNTLWTLTIPFQCIVPQSTGIFFVTSDVTADIILIAIPLRIFWRVRLPTVERYLVLGGFAASILTTMASISCAVILLGPVFQGLERFLLNRMMIQLLATISLIICNFLVIITRLYRLYQKLSHYLALRKLEKESTSSPSTSRTNTIILTELSGLSEDSETTSPESERRPSSILAPESQDSEQPKTHEMRTNH